MTITKNAIQKHVDYRELVIDKNYMVRVDHPRHQSSFVGKLEAEGLFHAVIEAPAFGIRLDLSQSELNRVRVGKAFEHKESGMMVIINELDSKKSC